MTIRPETPVDYAAIRAIHEAAFPEPTEAAIVDALRRDHDHVPELCLVTDDLVGHVMTSRATVGEQTVLALGPIAVHPVHQNHGIGAVLMEDVIERARMTDYPLLALIGHPRFYARFGFLPARQTYNLESEYDAPAEAWMALPLPAYAPTLRGTFRYAPGFRAIS
jgi:putative acetyltransferase